MIIATASIFWRNGDGLIQMVGAQCNQNIVVMHTVVPMLASEWHDNKNVRTILWAGWPGWESGNSIVGILLYGKYNHGVKLPFNLAPTAESYGSNILDSPNNDNGAASRHLGLEH